ncbi:MAG: DUF504 domain-containing protein [Thermofilum sp.]|uniref:DUF504 domain-containing protein n=1 Tax=Thermofilum sp. TaxID=1961369 RepID=UPI00258821CF|nr:DUF504 domain-containing protein [Thermofilum sp.]MCI4407913.1 DUF504 domain-containing protein [Thermofilum sp.]
MKNPMREYFNKLLWDKTVDKKQVKVKFVSRGTSMQTDMFTGEQVVRVSRDGVVILTESGTEKYIPYHRILEITYSGKTVFNKKEEKYFV